MEELVVIGNGMVGHRLVEALRDRDTAGHWHITVVGEEPRTAYDRVALSTYFDGATAQDLSLGELRGPRVDVHVAEQATTIDRAARTVTTTSGRVLPYDRLVLATDPPPSYPPSPATTCPAATSTAPSRTWTPSPPPPPAHAPAWSSAADSWAWKPPTPYAYWAYRPTSSNSPPT